MRSGGGRRGVLFILFFSFSLYARPLASQKDVPSSRSFKQLLQQVVDTEINNNSKAPRPGSQTANQGDAIVGKEGGCDLTPVLATLGIVKKLIDSLEIIICRKFQETWTVLADIEIEIIDTRTTLCEKFFETWTILDEIIDTQTILCEKFFETWTILDEINDNVIDTQTILCDKFFQTWTILADIEIEIIDTRTTLCEKFFETWTILDGIDEEIIDTQTVLCQKFFETWTILDNLNVTATVDLSGVYTALDGVEEALCDKFFETWTILDGITSTQTILCEKFNDTFTVFNNLENITINGFAGTFTVLDGLCDKFFETWTILADLSVTATVDFSSIFTVLDKIDQDVFDTQTILCQKFFETWTILDNLQITASVDLSSVFTALDGVEEALCEKFFQTWTILDAIEDDIDDLSAGLCSPIAIEQNDVLASTFTIATPGYYVFCEDIVFSPATGQPAIAIVVDNVIVDMCGKTLSQGNAIASSDGFVIQGGSNASPRRNVTIKNGGIADFTGIGIDVGTNTATPANRVCEIITLQNVILFNCQTRAITMIGNSASERITTSFIKGCKIYECCQGASGDVAIALTFVQDIAINNCIINENGITSQDFTALHLDNAIKVQGIGIQIKCNDVQNFIGIDFQDTNNCIISNCSIEVNQAAETFYGIRLNAASTVNRNTFVECAVNNNIAVDGPLRCYNGLAASERNIFRSCVAFNNRVTGTLATSSFFGFDLDQVNFYELAFCTVKFNTASGNGGSNIAAGFNVSTSGGAGTGCKNCQFVQNKAGYNNGFNDSRSFGLRLVSGNNGNENNGYIANVGMLNGPSSPITNNQITSTSGPGSSPGGITPASLRATSINNLNGNDFEYSNIRIT